LISPKLISFELGSKGFYKLNRQRGGFVFFA